MKKYLLTLLLVTTSLSWQAMAETENDDTKVNGQNEGGETEKMPLEESYQLEKVVMLSRHGIRAPLIGYGSTLASATPNQWVNWTTKGGHLTLKGGKLEGLFAQYLDYWLYEQGLIPIESCPEEDVLIYTNSLPRTIESGNSFVSGAYPNCDVKVYYREEVGKMDDTFNPIVRHETNEEFVAKATESVNQMLGDGGLAAINERLKSHYQILESILDYQNSESCRKTPNCKLANLENTLTFEQDKEPETMGALRLGTGAADSFILQYYEGYPDEEVAWGKIKTPTEWQAISDIKNLYTDLLFTSPVIAKEAATPLATFIYNAFNNHGYQHPFIYAARKAKFSLLIGHDSNIASLLSLLKVKPYHLDNQYEKTPISGKVAFQLWRNPVTEKKFMKIEYIYQTTSQLRDGTPLTKENPPKAVILEMENCPIDRHGFCPLETFDHAVNQVLQ